MAMSQTVKRRLRVNPTLCDGYGYCAEIVPELITLDDWGFLIVSTRNIDDENVLALTRRAIATCPRLALLLEETAERSQ